jgi:hypothetical protein
MNAGQADSEQIKYLDSLSPCGIESAPIEGCTTLSAISHWGRKQKRSAEMLRYSL